MILTDDAFARRRASGELTFVSTDGEWNWLDGEPPVDDL